MGQQAVTSVDGQGQVMLFYTRGDNTGTRLFRRVLDIRNMASPDVGDPMEVTTAGLTTATGAADHFNNAEFAYDPTRDRFYVVREQRPYPTDEPTYITARVQVASIEGSAMWQGGGTWRVEGSVDTALTGFARKHNAGIARSAYGTLADSNHRDVVFSTSCGNCASSPFTYEL